VGTFIPILWITREMMSRGPQVEIWSVERLHDQQYTFAQMENPLTTTDGHRFTDGIHHTIWLSEGNGFCSIRYNSVLL